MSIANIHKTLEDAIVAVGLPYPLQRENIRNDTTKPFSRFTLLPAETTAETIGVNGTNRWQGLAQIDIFVPIDSGTTAALAAADSIIAAFKRGTQLGTSPVIHIENCWSDGGAVINKFWNLAVTIRWRALIPA
jgi:hypothetical protein